jgi:hypothetical protein
VGTVPAADIRPGALSASPSNLTVIDNQLFFSATGPDLGSELWVLDLNLPEIAAEQPAGSGLVDGSSSRDFGVVPPGGNAMLVFTVRNTGTAVLNGLSVAKDGANSSDFTIGSLGATTLAPGASTTFAVTFAPGAAGARNAAIHVASDDPDENPFDVPVTGTGLTQLENWRLQYFGSTANSGDGDDANDYDVDGMTNFLEFCLRTDPTQASVLSQFLVLNGTNLEFTYMRAKAAVLDGVVFDVEWIDDLTQTNWSTAGVSETVLSDDGVVQQVKATMPAGMGGRRFVRLKATGQ